MKQTCDKHGLTEFVPIRGFHSYYCAKCMDVAIAKAAAELPRPDPPSRLLGVSCSGIIIDELPEDTYE